MSDNTSEIFGRLGELKGLVQSILTAFASHQTRQDAIEARIRVLEGFLNKAVVIATIITILFTGGMALVWKRIDQLIPNEYIYPRTDGRAAAEAVSGDDREAAGTNRERRLHGG